MSQRVKDLISQLTLEEKAALCSGENNWSSKAIERLNIPSIYMTDGPHGLRIEADDGFGNSQPATCFPTAACLASTWNPDLLEKVGAAIGVECLAYDVQIILGPGANIKRSPLNGRNFEYFSEDPKVSGEMAAGLIKGIQSQGVGTSLKHYVANNQEYERMSINATIDERTLREIYLAGFEIAVKKAQPHTLMCAYNRLNGIFASEHPYFLYDILKKEWNFKGIVMSDWGAVHDRVEAVKAGLHLEMPGNGGINDVKVVEGVQNGQLDEARLDEVVADWLNVAFATYEARQPNRQIPIDAHHSLAQQAATEGIVLLKNEQELLPLDTNQYSSIAVLGRFAKHPRFQGAGSSWVNASRVDVLLDEIKAAFSNDTTIKYAAGFDESHDFNQKMIDEAVQTAQSSELAIVCVGLPESFESEGTDRQHILLPDGDRALVEAVAAVQPNTIVVLTNGSPVEMPWVDKVPVILEGWLFGQGGGGAMTQILTGQVNPSGKITETFPKRLEDSPSYLHFPGTPHDVHYGEGIFVGYRYFEKKKVEPLFPFGHGLSYTKFEYSDLKISTNEVDNEPIQVEVTIKNIGTRSGKEIVQLYIKDVESTVIRPEKELKGFQKVALDVNEATTISFELSHRDFSYYETDRKSWHLEAGDFEILVGASSVDIRLSETISVSTKFNQPPRLDKYVSIKEFLKHPLGNTLLQPLYDEMMAFLTRSVPDDQPEKQEEVRQFFTYILNDMPFYKLETFSSGSISKVQLDEILEKVNG